VLHDLTFYYPYAPRPALSGVSLTVPPGSFLAIVGGSGSGKTTLMGMMSTWMQPSAGMIQLTGLDCPPFDSNDQHSAAAARGIRAVSSVVTQETLLLHGSIADNIAFGASVTTKETRDMRISWAASAAGCGFIAELPHGMQTVIGPKGISLSGGQAQRLCVARALCRQPSLLLLDEATSALDPDTEHTILRTIASLRTNYPDVFGKLIICLITHHPDTFQYADMIARVEGGILTHVHRQRGMRSD